MAAAAAAAAAATAGFLLVCASDMLVTRGSEKRKVGNALKAKGDGGETPSQTQRHQATPNATKNGRGRKMDAEAEATSETRGGRDEKGKGEETEEEGEIARVCLYGALNQSCLYLPTHKVKLDAP